MTHLHEQLHLIQRVDELVLVEVSAGCSEVWTPQVQTRVDLGHVILQLPHAAGAQTWQQHSLHKCVAVHTLTISSRQQSVNKNKKHVSSELRSVQVLSNFAFGKFSAKRNTLKRWFMYISDCFWP